MANSKSIVIIAGIVVAVIIGIALATSFESADSPTITQDEVMIEEGTVQTASLGDTGGIEESVEVTKDEVVIEEGTVQTASLGDTGGIEESVEVIKDETKFFINEDGNKTYVIDVRDTPSIVDD